MYDITDSFFKIFARGANKSWQTGKPF
jgi:hypothetical protein